MLPAGVSIRMLAWPVPVIRTALPFADGGHLATTLPDRVGVAGSAGRARLFGRTDDRAERTDSGRRRAGDLAGPAQAGQPQARPHRRGGVDPRAAGDAVPRAQGPRRGLVAGWVGAADRAGDGRRLGVAPQRPALLAFGLTRSRAAKRRPLTLGATPPGCARRVASVRRRRGSSLVRPTFAGPGCRGPP